MIEARLLAGLDPNPALARVLACRMVDPFDFSGLGMEERAGEWFDRFANVPEARLVMARARSAGIPRSWAREWWSDPDDIAAELAWDWWQAHERRRRCECGADPESMVDPENRNRPWPHGELRAEVYYCPACAEVDAARAELERSAQAAKQPEMLHGQRVRVVYREPGEPLRRQ